MGYFTPEMLYGWEAGRRGPDWIEIRSGVGGIFTDRASPTSGATAN